MYTIRPQYLFYLTLCFIVVIITLIICTIGMTVQKKRRLLRKDKIAGQVSEWLAETVLEDDRDAAVKGAFNIPGNIQVILRKKKALDIVLDELILLRKSFNGSAGYNLEKLYRQLQLNKLSLRKLQSRRWHIKIKGIQELASMKQEQHLNNITQYINHSNQYIRTEAQTALVRYWGYEGLQFLDFTDYPVTEWQQLNLMHLLLQQPAINDAPIGKWLNSSNASVVQFALKLVAEERDSRHYEAVIQCLGHPNEGVNVQAVLCLGQIADTSIIKTLIVHYKNANEMMRIAIVNVLEKTGTSRGLSFIRKKSTTDSEVVKLACLKHLQQHSITTRAM